MRPSAPEAGPGATPDGPATADQGTPPAGAARARARLRSLVDRPTLLIQLASIGSALFLVGLYSRHLTPDAYAAFVAVTAAQALTVALLASPASTSFVSQSAGEQGGRPAVGIGALLSSLAGIAPVGVVAHLVGLGGWGALCAGLSYVALLSADWSTSRLLGLGHFWTALAVTVVRLVVTVLAALVLLGALTEPQHPVVPYLALALGGVPTLLHVAAFLRIGHRDDGPPSFAPFAAINVGLWLVASLDRMVIGALTSSVAAATYGLTYGLVDRGYRAMSGSLVQRDLRKAFAGDSGLRPWGPSRLAGLTALAVVVSLGLSPAVRLISGGAYQPSVALCAAVTAAGTLSLAAAPALVACVATVPLRHIALTSGAVALLNAVLLLLLVTPFSALGAAAASVAAYLVWLLALTALFRRNSSRRSAHRADGVQDQLGLV